MIITERVQDLFTVSPNYMLAHCISADCAFWVGIAVVFDDLYNMRNKLLKIWADNEGYLTYGGAYLIDNVYNLVTKERSFEKPTYNHLEEALEDLKYQMGSNLQTKLAIPKIGCGLDRLEWGRVKEIIEKIFKDTDIEILVCCLGDN